MWFAEQGWAGIRLTLRGRREATSTRRRSGGDPQGAAQARARGSRLRRQQRPGRRTATSVQFYADRRFQRGAGGARRGDCCRCWPAARNCATCASTPATTTARCRSRVDRERAAAYGFSRPGSRAVHRHRAARLAAARVPPRRQSKCRSGVRFAGAEQFRMRGHVGPQAAPRRRHHRAAAVGGRRQGAPRRLADLAPEPADRPEHQGHRRTAPRPRTTPARRSRRRWRRRSSSRAILGLRGRIQREDDEAGAQMGFNTLIALVMIYVVMAAMFESLVFPIAILSSILFSLPRRVLVVLVHRHDVLDHGHRSAYWC